MFVSFLLSFCLYAHISICTYIYMYTIYTHELWWFSCWPALVMKDIICSSPVILKLFKILYGEDTLRFGMEVCKPYIFFMCIFFLHSAISIKIYMIRQVTGLPKGSMPCNYLQNKFLSGFMTWQWKLGVVGGFFFFSPFYWL